MCVDCHQSLDDSHDNQWAYDTLKQWFPNSKYLDSDHFAEGFTLGERGSQQAGNKLSYTAQNVNEAGIVRALALERMADYPSQNALIAVARGVKQPDELIRIGAISGAENFPPDVAWRVLAPLLEDDVLSVRIDAAASLSRFWRQWTPQQREQLKPALDEYIKAQQYNADRAAGRVSLGNVYARMGGQTEAELAYKGAIEVEPIAAAGYVNLADLYRQQGKDTQAAAVFEQGIEAGAADATLHYAYGLNLVRQNAYNDALAQLKQANALDERNPQYWYVTGLAAKEVDIKYSVKALGTAYQLSANPQHLYALCEVMIEAKDSNANRFLDQLAKSAPAEVVQGLRSKLRQ